MLRRVWALCGVVAAAGGCSGAGPSAGGMPQAGVAGQDAGSPPSEGVGDATKTVRGAVFDRSGAPVAGYSVTIGGQSAVTAADGTFAITGVADTYDAVLADTSRGATCVYQGLTRRDPRLTVPFFGPGGAVNATATVHGMLPAESASQGVRTYFVAPPPGGISLVGDFFGTGPGYYEPVRWNATTTPTLHGKLHVLGFDLSSDLAVSSFTGYSALGMALNPNDDVGMDVASLGAVSNGTLSAVLPGGPGSVTATAILRTPDGSARLEVASVEAQGNAADLPVPLVPGAAFFVSASQYTTSVIVVGGPGVTVRRAATPGVPITFAFPPEPTLTTPPDLATGIDDTAVFGWSAQGPGVYDFFVQQVTFEGSPNGGCCEQGYRFASADVYEVITASPQATLAQMSAMTRSPSTEYYWGVRAYPDRLSVDDAAGPQAIDWECDATAAVPDGEAVCADSGTQRFVTR